MKRQQIEAWALQVLSATKSAKRNEDSRVELKAEFPEPSKAARRIAGHANAARGEPILWIIGLSEDGRISATERNGDISDWWRQVAGNFDGTIPALVDIALPTDDGVLELLFFETDSSPYVIRNPSFGQPGAGAIEREVPWREATAVRTATRNDLLLLLVPQTYLPIIELLSATIATDMIVPGLGSLVQSGPPLLRWTAHITMYVTPRNAEPVVLPIHRTKITFCDANAPKDVRNMRHTKFSLPVAWRGSDVRSDSHSIEVSGSEAIVHLPGRLVLTGEYDEKIGTPDPFERLLLDFQIRPANQEATVRQSHELRYSGGKDDFKKSWTQTYMDLS